MNKRKCMYCDTSIHESMGYVLPRDALILLEGKWDFATMGRPRELCPSYVCMDKWNKELKEEIVMEEELKKLIEQAHEAGCVYACWADGGDYSNEQYHKSEDDLRLAVEQFLQLIGQTK
jgi:hypothetical protein